MTETDVSCTPATTLSLEGEQGAVTTYSTPVTIPNPDSTLLPYDHNAPHPTYGFHMSSPWYYPPLPYQPWTLNYSGEGDMNVISSSYQPLATVSVSGSRQPTYSGSHSNDTLQFNLKFIEGNVSVCFGCRNKYGKNLKEPHNICLQTSEPRVYTPQGSSVQQSRWGNTYYHCKIQCVRLKWPNFHPQMHVIVHHSIKEKLSPLHKGYISSELGLHLF